MREVIRSCPLYTVIISPFANQPSRRPTQYFEAHARAEGILAWLEIFPYPPVELTNLEQIWNESVKRVVR